MLIRKPHRVIPDLWPHTVIPDLWPHTVIPDLWPHTVITRPMAEKSIVLEYLLILISNGVHFLDIR